MSENLKLKPGPNVSGTVVLGFGPQSVDWISKASKLCGKTAVMDPRIAHMAGANLAAGTPEALAALGKRLEAGALEAVQEANPDPGLAPGAARWLACGERGVSSNTIFAILTGIDALGDWRKDHPHDPADFRRCRLLLEQVPALQPHLSKMRSVSPEWAALVDAWDTICATMDEEAPDWREKTGRSAPKTYELIKKAIGR